MPNWCKGELKVRGTKESIKRFIIEGLQPVGYSTLDKVPENSIDEGEHGISRSINSDKFSAFYLVGTSRNFIESKDIEIYWHNNNEKQILVLSNYKAAWDIDVEGLVNLSQQFKVDFKIFAFERGMEFNRDVEIVGDKTIKNNIIKFDDYEWECVCPSIGG